MSSAAFFPKIGKWLTSAIKDKSVTYSNSSLNPNLGGLLREPTYRLKLVRIMLET